MERKFVPTDFDVDNKEEVIKLYQQLLDEELPDAKALRAWVDKTNELDTVLSEVSCRRYVATTVNTADEEAARAYQSFEENIGPIMSEYGDKVNKKLMGHPNKDELKDELEELYKGLQVAIDIYSKDNIPLQVELSKEIQDYQKITGGMSVEFEGKTQTMPQMGKYLEKTDRDLRERAWRAIQERRMKDGEALNASFDRMFALRNRIAKNSGCKDFIDYIYKAKCRFDYTPKECYDFHESVEKFVLPLVKEIAKRRAEQMKLDRLRPWDMAVDPLNREPLKPFSTGAELIEKVDGIFEDIHPQAGKWARIMQKDGLIDAESRIGKAPGGYQIDFDESGEPFIFMNAAGTDGDIYTLLHESGHSFHHYCRQKQLACYRYAPAEFAEVASMSMELIGMQGLGKFYSSAEDIERSRIGQLEGIITLFPWIASVDQFQHELYSRPSHTAADREKIWLGILDRYATGMVDYSGVEYTRKASWQRQLHIFECPFYYIEYGIAQLGAIQVWKNYKENPKKAIDDLFAAESLGSSRPLPELFAAANIKFDFTADTIEPLTQFIWDELNH